MTLSQMLLGCLVMFAVTYATKAVGLLLVKKQIRNRYIQSFLYYLPYSVLAVMVFPSIFFSTTFFWSGLAGAAVALLLSFFRCGLLPVALASIAAVYIVEQIFLLLA